MTPVDDRYAFGIPALARQSPGTGTQPVTDRFAYRPPPRSRTRARVDRVRDEWLDMPNSVPIYGRLSPKTEECDSQRSPEAELMDTVAHLQLKVEALKFVQSAPLVLVKRTLSVLSKPVVFSGETSWKLVGKLVGISTAKCLTPSSDPMGGTTPRSPYNFCLTWRVTH